MQLRSGASLPAPSRADQNIADMVQSSPLESNRHFLHGNGVRAAHDNLFKPLFSHRGNAQWYLANVLWLWFEHHANAIKVNMNLYLHFATDISEVNSIFSEKKKTSQHQLKQSKELHSFQKCVKSVDFYIITPGMWANDLISCDILGKDCKNLEMIFKMGRFQKMVDGADSLVGSIDIRRHVV